MFEQLEVISEYLQVTSQNHLAFLLTPSALLWLMVFLVTFSLPVLLGLESVNRARSKTPKSAAPVAYSLDNDDPAPATLWVRRGGWLASRALMLWLTWYLAAALLGFAFFTTVTVQDWIINGAIADHWLHVAYAVPAVIALVLMYLFRLFVIGRRLAVWLNRCDEQFRKQLAGRDGLSDARSLDLPARIEYDPESYFAQAAAQNVMMLGLDEQKKQVTVPRALWVKSHVQVMGAPGKGKGVLAGVVLSQSIRFGDLVVVFDPKNDEWAPSVLAHACAKRGAAFHLVNLNRGMPPQINPLEGATADEASELIEVALGLGSRGSEGDHYRIGDRKVARRVVRDAAAAGRLSLPDLYAIASELPKELRDEGADAIALLAELAELTAVQTASGAQFDEMIRQGGCLYIVGNTRDEAVIRCQRLLLLRLVQIRERNPHAHRHITAFTDEVKYLLSGQLLNALGTIRDKGMNIILSHQSRGDFSEVPGVGEAAARAIVEDTTPLKWLYQTSDYETAQWISSKTGLINVSTERRSVSRNEGDAERLEGHVELAETQRHLIDTNTVQHMPEGCAVVVGAGKARLAFASPVRVQKQVIALKPAPALVIPSAFEDVAPVRKAPRKPRTPKPKTGSETRTAPTVPEMPPVSEGDYPECYFDD